MHFNFTQPVGLWAYLLLAFVVIFEGPIATLVAAVAASTGIMNPFGVFFAAGLGNLTSDTLWFYLGYLGKTDLLFKYASWLKIRKEYLEHLEGDISLHVQKLLFLSKLTLGFSIPVLIATGMARVPIRRWFWVLLLTEILWTGTLVILGYFFGRYLTTLERGVQIVAFTLSLVFVGILIYYLARLKQRIK